MIEILFGTVVAVLTGAVGWLLVTVISNARDVAVLAARLDEADVRAELAVMHLRVNETGREVSGLSGQLKQINRTVGLIQQLLMQSAGGHADSARNNE